MYGKAFSKQTRVICFKGEKKEKIRVIYLKMGKCYEQAIHSRNVIFSRHI